jgi:hypothetical protein
MSDMFVFIVANLPLPIIFYLNCLVTLKFLKVRRLARHAAVERPERLIAGWWLGNISMLFVLTPMLTERRIFVQNHWWLLSYATAATLSISGLLLMNSGLGKELRQLTRAKRQKPIAKPVDRGASDTL